MFRPAISGVLMNRHARRAERALTKAEADRTAALLARFVLDIGGDGQSQLVSNPRAVAILQQAFRHVLRHGLEPHVMRLSDDTARAFLKEGEEPSAGASYYLAAGLDVAGRASFLMRPFRVRGATSPAHARRVIEDLLIGELRQHLADASPLPTVTEWTAP